MRNKLQNVAAQLQMSNATGETNMPEKEGLVLHNSQERLLTKISQWKEERITVQEKESYDKAISDYSFAFRRLAQFWYGLSKELLCKLDSDEFLDLEQMIFKKATKKYRMWKFAFSVPVIGWISYPILCDTCPAFINPKRFVRSRKRLQEFLGEKFFSVVKEHTLE